MSVTNKDVMEALGTFNNKIEAMGGEPRSSVHMPVFHGLASESVHGWLQRLSLLAQVHGWSEQKTVGLLRLNLAGVASKWYEAEFRTTQPKSFDSLCKIMVEKFGRSKELLREDLLHRVQLPGESVMAYATTILDLCDKVDPGMPERDRVYFIIRGFSPVISEHMYLHVRRAGDKMTVAEVIKEAELKESSLSMVSQHWFGSSNFVPAGIPRPPVVAAAGPTGQDRVSNLETKLEQLISLMTKNQMNQKGGARNERTADGQPICNYCKKAGHIARHCEERQKKVSQGDRSSPQGNGQRGVAPTSQ